MKKVAVLSQYGWAAAKTYIAHMFDALVGLFGFLSWYDFVWSIAKPKLILFMSPIIAALAAIASYAEIVIGVKANIVIAFMLLNVAEWATGVWAALTEGKVFSSWKFSRAILKTFVYVVMLGVIHQLKGIDEHGMSAGVFSGMYWSVLFGISIVLTRSVFENLHRMGIKEASVLYTILNNKYTRILTGEPEPAKAERK